MKKIENWLVPVLRAIDASDHDNFGGLGLVFYTNKEALPVHPLVSLDESLLLPTKTLQESIELLVQVSRRTSVYHDGFHLVDAKTLHVTDVSQFLSPPIPPSPLALDDAAGARHMAARLASLMPEVQLTITYALGEEANLYEGGDSRLVRIPSIAN